MKITNKDIHKIICSSVHRCVDCIIGFERISKSPGTDICKKIFPTNFSDEYDEPLKEYDMNLISEELKNKIYEVVIEYKLKNQK